MLRRLIHHSLHNVDDSEVIAAQLLAKKIYLKICHQSHDQNYPNKNMYVSHCLLQVVLSRSDFKPQIVILTSSDVIGHVTHEVFNRWSSNNNNHY